MRAYDFVSVNEIKQQQQQTQLQYERWKFIQAKYAKSIGNVRCERPGTSEISHLLQIIWDYIVKMKFHSLLLASSV